MEVWRPVVGYEGFYEVSDAGRVRSLNRVVMFSDGRVRRFAGRPCKPKLNEHGYPLTLLSQGMARKKWVLTHRVVLEAFVGPCPIGMEGCHNDGNPLNAALANLRYDTRKNNMADKRRHGTHLEGASHPSARLSAATVEQVRSAGGTMDVVSAQFGISRTHAWNIQNGKRRANG